MKSTKLIISLILILLLLLGVTTPGHSQDSQQLFQKGLMKEKGEGELQEAIAIYESIIADDKAESSVKAKAQLHIGLCYEKLGKKEAIKAYELVVQNYKGYEDEVKVANSRLSELRVVELDDEKKVVSLYHKDANLMNGTMLDGSSLSPDGTKLIGIDYTVGQNVGVYDINTKEVNLVTNYDWTSEGAGWAYFTTWSPNSKEVAFMYSGWSGGNMEVRISDLDGNTRTLLSEPTNAQIIPRQWSKDGSVILAFVQDSEGYYTIALVSVEDGSITKLYKTQWTGKLIKGDASLSSDGNYIVFADGPVDKLDLYVMTTQGGEPWKISSYPTNEHNPLWSPNGEHIAYIKETKGEGFLYGLNMKDGKPVGPEFLIESGMKNASLKNWTVNGICSSMDIDIHDLHVIPMDSETGIPVGDPEPLDYAPTGSNVNPVYSYDGKFLAFITYDVKPQVVVLPTDGGDPSYFTIPEPGFEVIYTHDLRWLPDNSGLGLSTMNTLEKPVLYQIDIESGEWQKWDIPAPGWSRTDWGPEENTVIYSVNGDTGPGLYQMNTITGETKHIFTPEEAEYYAFRTIKFSRDHKKLVFYQEKAMIMLYDFVKEEGKLLIKGYGNATFSPDGNKILASSKNQLYFFSLEGEELYKYSLVEHFAQGTRIWGYDWSPDGKYIVFMTRNFSFETNLIKNVVKY